jgi:MFS family permease
MMFGRFSSYEHVAYLVAGPIGGYLASSYGLRVPMWATVVPVVIAFGICFSLTEPRVHKKVERSYFSTMLDGIKYFRKHKVLQVLAFDRISINLFTWIVFWMYQPLLTERGVSLFYFGIFYSAIFGVPILFYRNLERLERLFGSKKKFLFFSALISSLSLILLGTFDSLVLMSILLIMYFSLNGSRFLLLINYMNKYIPSKIRATVMSTMSMIESFLYAFVFLLTGVLIEWNLLMTFVLFGSFTLIATFFSGVKEEHLLD